MFQGLRACDCNMCMTGERINFIIFPLRELVNSSSRNDKGSRLSTEYLGPANTCILVDHKLNIIVALSHSQSVYFRTSLRGVTSKTISVAYTIAQ